MRALEGGGSLPGGGVSASQEVDWIQAMTASTRYQRLLNRYSLDVQLQPPWVVELEGCDVPFPVLAVQSL